MAEVVAGAFLSVVFTKLYEQLASPMVEFGTNSVGSKLKMLEEKLKNVSVYLDDAEDRQLSDKKVKEWLDDLKDVVFIVDDLVEQINDSKKKKGVASWILSLYHSLAKKGENDLTLKKLDGLYERARDLEQRRICSSADHNRRSSPTIVAPLRDERHVYGREAEKEEILKMLKLSEEDKMIVLPVVGMGGLGKTTLAQLVYYDKRVEEHDFSLKAWVTLSNEFDVCWIMKELLQKVNPGVSISDPSELQQLMKEGLKGQRFLFVLDNVWEVSYNNWDPLKNIFEAGDRSRVIVTTRSRVVGSSVKTGPIHELKEVQKDDCFKIFAQHAFNGNTNPDQRLQEIGGRIVEKCKGLPLAIRCLGGRLCSERNPQNWENFLLNDLGDWSNLMENEVLPSLWWSYKYLSLTVKQCFAYCSLFPQGYEFRKKEIVLLWMAEGFILEGKSMEDDGQKYFDDLVSRSLFQRSSEDDDTHVVHHLVHYLAAFVYGSFCWRIGDDLKYVTSRTRHVTFNKDVSSDYLLTSLSISKHLRTLMNIQASEHQLTFDFVKNMVRKVRRLRVLTISLARSVVCNALGDLKMLRYLNLSGSEIEKLPDSICCLSHLQTLILFRCNQITRLPTDLPAKLLIKLRYLGTLFTGLTKMPPKMGTLKELRTLANFVLGRGGESGCSRLKELGELHHLSGLVISNLQNVDSLDDVQSASLIGKEDMKKLVLSWGIDDTGNNIQAVDVLEKLQPHENLEKLEVYHYPGSSFPKWVGDRCFSKLASVRLNGINDSCQLLPPLGQLPFLRELRIECFEGVKKIGNEFLYANGANSSNPPFPLLETLSFHEMEGWEEWSFVRNESACFPRLRSLHISHCHELESIIREDDGPSLCQLTIEDCRFLEKRYRKYNGEHWRYIPIIHIDGDTTRQLKWEEEQTRQQARRILNHETERQCLKKVT